MSRAWVRVEVNMEPELVARLEAEARREGQPRTVIIRRLLDKGLPAPKPKKP